MPTVDQIDSGLVLWVAASKPHRLVVEVELREAGNDAGDDLGGRRSSGEVEHEATGQGEARGVVLRVPTSAVSALVTVVWPVGGRSHVSDELGGGGCG